MGRKLPGILRFLPGPTIVPRERVSATLKALAPDRRILDVGAGGRRIVPDVIALDAVPMAGVDVVADLHRLPFRDEAFDCVFCTGTLQHVRNPGQAVREMYRVLRPGGVVHIDVAFMQGYMRDPDDFWRFTVDGLKLLCQDFKEIASGVHIGSSCAVVWIVREWANSCVNNRWLANFFLIPVALLTAPFRYLDYLIQNPQSHRVASAVYFCGHKPPVSS
jgi:SAM-dependent methyltransferase